jgi:hypothetical protein
MTCCRKVVPVFGSPTWTKIFGGASDEVDVTDVLDGGSGPATTRPLYLGTKSVPHRSSRTAVGSRFDRTNRPVPAKVPCREFDRDNFKRMAGPFPTVSFVGCPPTTSTTAFPDKIKWATIVEVDRRMLFAGRAVLLVVLCCFWFRRDPCSDHTLPEQRATGHALDRLVPEQRCGRGRIRD